MMYKWVKRKLYFLVAGYFAFFARIFLMRWQPRIIVVTGSSGKTTLLNLLEATLGLRAKYSHLANSAFGVPWHILGLKRKNFALYEYIFLILRAPLAAFGKLPRQKIYVVECDCDRVGEGKFLARLLKPAVVVWTNVAVTHSQNFDSLVAAGKYKKVEEAIASEFGWLARAAREQVYFNGDNQWQNWWRRAEMACRERGEVSARKQNGRRASRQNKIMYRGKVSTVTLREKTYLKKYEVSTDGTIFTLQDATIKLPYLLPREAWWSLEVCVNIATQCYRADLTKIFRHLRLPPGRNSLFRGINKTWLIDSTYNSDLGALTAMLNLQQELPGGKWVVLGDILEQGKETKETHEKLAQILSELSLEKIFLVGPRLREYTAPILEKIVPADGQARAPIKSVLYPREIVDDLRGARAGTVILFKGARFLEGLVEKMLVDKSDIKKLPRREFFWQSRRARFY